MRAYRKISLVCGVFTIPVSIVKPFNDTSIRGHRIDPVTKTRVSQAWVTEDGQIVSETVIGYPVSNCEYTQSKNIDGYVVLEESEYPAHESSRFLKIDGFVNVDEIDPIYYDDTYLLLPQAPEAEIQYDLFLAALKRTRNAAIGTWTLLNKERVAIVRYSPMTNTLVLHLLHFHEEFRHKEIGEVSRDVASRQVDPKHLDLVLQLVESLKEEFVPEAYEDTYRTLILEAIAQKARHGAVTPKIESDNDAPIPDFLESLKASLEEARSRHA